MQKYKTVSDYWGIKSLSRSHSKTVQNLQKFRYTRMRVYGLFVFEEVQKLIILQIGESFFFKLLEAISRIF